MKIKSNAVSTEITSPFYLRNKEKCLEFESYIATKKGKVKGSYNAWSYLIYGKIEQPRPWLLVYEKSTFTYVWNIFLSSKRQSLRILCKWSTTVDENPNFIIKRKTIYNSIAVLLNKKVSILMDTENYIIKTNNASTKLISDISKSLKPLFKNRKVHKIILKEDKLTIILHTSKLHLETFESLLTTV